VIERDGFLLKSLITRGVIAQKLAEAYRVRHCVAKSRHVSSFAWPARFISCHSRPQSRIRAREAAGKEGNTVSVACAGNVVVGPEGAVCFGGA
jgi:hypothetical protein